MLLLIPFLALYIFFLVIGEDYPSNWQQAAVPAAFFTGMIAVACSLIKLISAIGRRPRLRSALFGVLCIVAVATCISHKDAILDRLRRSFIKAYNEFPFTAPQFKEDLLSTSLQLQELPSTSLELPTVRFDYPYSPGVVDYRDGYVVPHPELDYTVDDEIFEKEVNLEAEKVALWILPPWVDDHWRSRMEAWRQSFGVQTEELARNTSAETEGFTEFLNQWNLLQDVMSEDQVDVFRLFQGVWRSERALHRVFRKLKQT